MHGVKIQYFDLKSFDLTEFTVWTIKGPWYWVATKDFVAKTQNSINFTIPDIPGYIKVPGY